ncbi:enoyl-CoA hydratase/isomerase family protein [Novosphingobium album (ex Liu et al. 2023)]|uniref:Enoyl-CoA hydratase/isomerase family protein n=1 Tax=Novosphingobium album (ex Liu et al. 2023) TaxID=3031130 RepID=A0ABT5WUD9_9SPHN|nr:enoyl-CoA hydratase/isomerase family protein [Novosphingobium album (ex Liu et al. 2023)]MDE8653468.1 enoyl-CoA hydratase/isomerase family protein [Novosphingobium album (ex Liu et al. 2023)]
MDTRALTIAARRLWVGESPFTGPLAFVDLDACGEEPFAIALPPCPVIGFGVAAGWLAGQLDAVIAPPVTPAAIAAQVMARPLAAASVVQLLRLLPGLDGEQGLVAESMAYAMLQASGEHSAWQAARPSGMAPAAAGTVRVERRDDRLTITLDRPDAGNAIDRAMRDALHEALALAAADPDLTRISLRAAGKAFSLGADLAEFGTTADPATAHAIRARTLPARMALRCADRLDAHVRGACIGAGLELAAFAARLTAAPGAWFQLPELAMGILPGAGGCVSLTRRVGRQRAALLILSGKRLSARQALDWGLIDAIVDEAP